LAVVLGGAIVTYGGVSLFVAFFVLVPMAQRLFRQADIPKRLVPAAIALGTSTFTMSALPGTPAIQNAIPMPYFGTTLFAAPGLGAIAAVVMLGFGLWWLARAQRKARFVAEGYGELREMISDSALLRERASTAREFDPAELTHGQRSQTLPPVMLALAPLLVVIVVNLLMSLLILPRMDASYLQELRWGSISLREVAGVWSVIVALAAGICALLALHFRRLPKLRDSFDAGVNACALPILSVSSLVGFGAVVAGLPAFIAISERLLSVGGGPLVSLAIATNTLAALTGSASGGLTIALDALAGNFVDMAQVNGIDPALMHRVAVIGAGTLDMLPHNGAVVSLLAICGVTHREGYFDIVMTSVVGVLLALVAVIALGSVFGSF
jgi:H+/gluconate symporter-like permease